MSSGPLSLPAVNLGGLAIESFVFGNFFLLTIASMVLMAHREARLSSESGRLYDLSVVKKPIFIGGVMMLMFVTGVRLHLSPVL